MDLIKSGHHDQNQYYLLSKIAMSDQHAENSPYFEGWKTYNSDPFDTLHNPNGVIQMGLSENKLSLDLIQEWILKNPKSSICTFEGLGAFKDVSIFQDYHGLSEFRNAIARFMGRVMGQTRVSFDPNRIVMGGGATGASELLMFCLADGGDAFLVPTPYYPAFDRDLRWRTNLQLIPVICSSSNNFQITIEALEKAYEKAIRSNIKVKGLILSNPSNPLGTVLNISTLKSLLSFVTRKNIHLVCDEIYAGTVFKKPRFVSVSEALHETEGVNKNLVHIIYSLSKDLGLTGFRVGIVYSYNDYVVNSARKMSSFGLVSTQTQYLIASMLLDDDFVDGFLDENAKRLGSRHKLFIEGLMGYRIKCLESNAGLFCWMDLRHMLKGGTTQEEIGLWRVIINQVKLNISPGSSFHCSEPGWFRVCFANIDNETVKIALKRFGKFVRDDRVNKERDLKIATE